MDATLPPASAHLDDPPGFPQSRISELLRLVVLRSGDARAAMARRMDLSPSEVDAMEHVMGDTMGPVELSRRLHMTSASATVLVDRLEQAGHVHREPDPEDGRRRVVRPTGQGARAVFAQVEPLVADLVAAEGELDQHQRDVVTAYLERVVAILGTHAAAPGDSRS